MPDKEIDDFDFLTELIRQVDAAPGSRVTGRDVAAGLAQPAADVEPNIRRLKNRGLIDWSPAPARAGDGWKTRGLAVTADGYRFDGTGLSR